MSKKPSRREIEFRRKDRMARANRLLAWVTFACFVLSRIGPRVGSISAETAATLNTIFIVCIFLHSIAGVYLYGLPQYTNHPRVWQMYIGFSVFAVFLLNRSFVFVPFMRDLTDMLLWVPIILHVAIGFRYGLLRLIRSSKLTTLPYYLGGSIVRDVSRHLEK